MGLPKLLDLLCQEQLYFCQASRLPDRFEGALPKRIQFETTPGENRLLTFARARYSCCVNCWCRDTDETIALWRIYAGDSGGVAVRSTVAKLRSAVASSNGRVEAVQYVDIENDTIEADKLIPILVKRKEFRYEQEVRAWVVDPTISGGGTIPDNELLEKIRDCQKEVFLPIDPVNFIDSIVVSPFAPDWYAKVVEQAVQKICPGISVERSTLSGDPGHIINYSESERLTVNKQLLLPFTGTKTGAV